MAWYHAHAPSWHAPRALPELDVGFFAGTARAAGCESEDPKLRLAVRSLAASKNFWAISMLALAKQAPKSDATKAQNTVTCYIWRCFDFSGGQSWMGNSDTYKWLLGSELHWSAMWMIKIELVRHAGSWMFPGNLSRPLCISHAWI